MQKIGIVGGGQLGRMLVEAADQLHFETIVLDPTPRAPAGQVATEQIIKSFKDPEAIRELADRVDFLTFEIEQVHAEVLEEIANDGKPVNPSPSTLKIIKDKFEQKAFLQNADIPVTDFALIETKHDVWEQAKIFGYPFLLKARFDAYDGRGNALIKSEDQIDFAYEHLSKSPLYVERFVPFVKELSAVVVRGMDGDIRSYPIVETIHRNNICHEVFAPAPVAEDVRERAEALGRQTLEHLGGVGVYAIEMFLTENGKILVNDIAPRVHNSGHHTIEACATSQFENHIRAITSMPLGSTDMIVPRAVMVNILGDRSGEVKPEGIEEAEALGGVAVHMYGKMETRPERKMGHITAIGSTLEEVQAKARKARSLITI